MKSLLSIVLVLAALVACTKKMDSSSDQSTVAGLAGTNITQSFPVTTGPHVTWTTDATQTTDNSTNQDPTDITTYKNSIYWIYTDSLRNLVVAKKTGTTIQRVIVFPLETQAADNFHVCPSIGIDETGHIHIAADMHNDSWKYYRSNNSEDITSWTRRTDLPGKGVTYPTFHNDTAHHLYVCFRMQGSVGSEPNVKGNQRAGLVRFDAPSNTFTLIGGISYNDVSQNPGKNPPVGAAKPVTIAWSNGFGGNNCWYIKPGHRVFFDGNNRMHFICTVINKCIDSPLGYESNTHILYAYSDDFGVHWKKAGGVAIDSLPLTVNNASIVLDRTAQNDIIGGECELGAFNTNTPVVSYLLGDLNKTKHSVKWNGTAWEEITPPHSTNLFMSANNGYSAWYDGSNVDYTADGVNWTTVSGSGTAFPRYNMGPVSHTGLDREYFKQSGNFRYQGSQDNTFHQTKVFTLNTNISH